LEYDDSTYVDLLASTSAYRLLEPTRREQLFDDVRTALAGHDGSVAMHVVTDLFLGRTTPVD
jgi:hypothetical protein